MMDITNIRKVKIGDADILAYIQTESWKSAFSKILSKEDLNKYTNIDRATDMYNGLLSKNIGNGYILSINDIPHCIAYWDKARDDEIKEYAEIICIHSLPENWGKGYGTSMMEYILKEIKDAGFNNVVLWVFKENKRACRFYESHGFILTDKSKKFCDALEVMYCREL
ncbi:MAG: GNAT family N-acetyltransferase [Romboutsia sp.]|uniref:GNAT family N-acetyltransferase n=1 Tax=Romboutsia sp. TaxID=1965302 RepID=UPI003F38C3CA